MSEKSTSSAAPAGQDLLDRAMQASAAGAAEEAIQLFRAAAAALPGTALPLFLLGAELAQIGAIDEAEQAFAGAVLLAPQLHTARFQLGLLQFSSGRAAQALLTWQPLQALDEGLPWPHLVGGFAALAADSFTAATRAFEIGIERNTENPPLNADIRLLLQRIAELQSQPTEAAPAPAEAGDSEEAGSHLLLANYRPSPLH